MSKLKQLNHHYDILEKRSKKLRKEHDALSDEMDELLVKIHAEEDRINPSMKYERNGGCEMV